MPSEDRVARYVAKHPELKGVLTTEKRNDATAQWLVAYNRIAPTNDPGVFRSIGPIRSDDLDYKVYPMLAGGRRR